MNNLDIRLFVEESGLFYKDIAKEMGVSREWLSKLMNKTISEYQKERIWNAALKLKEKKEHEQ